jgi:hypothetical protein
MTLLHLAIDSIVAAGRSDAPVISRLTKRYHFFLGRSDMKRAINSLLCAIIAIGAYALLQAAPAGAQAGAGSVSAASTIACCSNGKVIVCGDQCTGNPDGTCKCQ